MQMKITNQRDNLLLSRKEIDYELVFEGKTPSREDVKKTVAKSTKTTEDLIVIKNIYNSFGMRKASVGVYVYKDKKKMELIEPKQKEKKEGEEKKEVKEKPKQEVKKDGKEEKKEENNK